MAKPIQKEYRKYGFMLVAIWTVVILASLGWNVMQLKQALTRIARTSAEISYNKDLLYRRWVSLQGGVYVPVSEATPSNPYITIPNRDVTTTTGLVLTLVNPAYMTRQVNELAAEMGNFQGHITSLNPIRPENHPDPWEAESLKTFEEGMAEAFSVQRIAGKDYFRFMRPFFTEKSCLICHASQGYQVGDVRGGISISIPREPLRMIERSQIAELAEAHGFLWIIGLAGIGFGVRRLRGQMRQRKKLEEELLHLSITDPLTGLHNRRGFLFLAEQQLKLSDRNKRGVHLYFADLDGLKGINDTLGHEEGDRALLEATAVLKEAFRASDIIARLGGDEFAALAMDIAEEKSEVVTARVQSLIDERNRLENRAYRLSISLGSSFYDPGKPCSLDELMAQADRRMYERKKNKPAVR